MLTRIEVGQKSPTTDSQGRKILAAIQENFRLPVEKVAVHSAYTLEMELRGPEKERIARELFTDPITEVFTIDAALAKDFDFLVEVGYKPGVTDNVGRSSREGIADLLGKRLADGDQVFTSLQFLLSGGITRVQAETLATKLLANALIQTYLIRSRQEWATSPGIPATSGKVTFRHQPETRTIELPSDDEGLQKLSDEKVLALTIPEMHAIQAYYADPNRRHDRSEVGLPSSPTDVELEVIAQTWSEHCKHKIFAASIEYTDDQGKQQIISSLYKTFCHESPPLVERKTPRSVLAP